MISFFLNDARVCWKKRVVREIFIGLNESSLSLTRVESSVSQFKKKFIYFFPSQFFFSLKEISKSNFFAFVFVYIYMGIFMRFIIELPMNEIYISYRPIHIFLPLLLIIIIIEILILSTQKIKNKYMFGEFFFLFFSYMYPTLLKIKTFFCFYY